MNAAVQEEKNEKKIPWLKIGLPLVYLAGSFFFRKIGITCIWLWLFHIPCPGCGMTRAVLAALQLDFAGAFAYHPLVWTMPILAVLYLRDGKFFGNKLADELLLGGICVLFVLMWAIRLAVGF